MTVYVVQEWKLGPHDAGLVVFHSQEFVPQNPRELI